MTTVEKNRHILKMTAKLTAVLAGIMMIATDANADGNISGSVFSKTTAEPLDFINVTLIDMATGKPLPMAVSSDGAGLFTFEAVPSGHYLARFTNIGTLPFEREVTVADKDVNMGRIELTDDVTLLQEVVVSGQKSQVSVNAERRVFNVSSNIA